MSTTARTLFDLGLILCAFSTSLAASVAIAFFVRGSLAIQSFWRDPMLSAPAPIRLEALVAACVFGPLLGMSAWLFFPRELAARWDPMIVSAVIAAAGGGLLYRFLRLAAAESMPRKGFARMGRTGLWIVWGATAAALFFLVLLPLANVYGGQALDPRVARPLALLWTLSTAAGASLALVAFAGIAWSDPLRDFSRAWRIAGLGGGAMLALVLAVGQGFFALGAYPRTIFAADGPGGRRLEIVARGIANPRVEGLLGGPEAILWRSVFETAAPAAPSDWQVTWTDGGRGVQIERAGFVARTPSP